MPFDFDTYQNKCENLTPEQLHREWENYTRQISGGATSTATAVLFSPLTAGISLVGLGLSAPRIHNARKKRAIIEAKLQAHGQTPNTRKRDVIAPMAISGTIGGLTLGLAGPGADIIAGEAVGKGAEYAAAHVALDATGAVVEHKHDEHSKKKANQRMTMQYENFQKQFIQEQAAQGIYFQPPLPGYQQGQQNLPGQQFQLQQPGNQTYQPLPPSQDQKYEFVPIPAPQSSNISYQPASHQQNFVPPGGQPPPNIYQQLPPYTLIHKSGPPGNATNILAQDPSRRQSLYQPGSTQAYPSPCPTPLPVYSQSPDPWGQQNTNLSSAPISPIMDRKPAAVQSAIDSSDLDCKSSIVDFPMDVFELPAELVSAAVPDDYSIPVNPSMEDEILILKARILQMEIEKRGGVIDIAPAHKSQPEERIASEIFLQDTERPRTAPAAVEEPAQHRLVQDGEGGKIEPPNDQEHSPQCSTVASVVVEEPAEYQTTNIEIKVATETVRDFYDFEPLSFYPPPPASPAPPPSLLPAVPILQTTVQEITTLSSQLSLEPHWTPQAQNSLASDEVASPSSDPYTCPYPAPLNVAPIRQQTSPLPTQAFDCPQPTPRHSSLTPNYQSPHTTPGQPQPPLPSRPQSQIFQTLPVTQPQGYLAPSQPQIQAPQPQAQPQATCQNQYPPQPISVSGSYNPQIYSPASSQIQQQPQVPASRPQSVYQPLSFQTSQNTAPIQQHSYPPPPPSPNPQQQRPAPPPRPQSVYQPQYTPPLQTTAPISYQQQSVPSPRPQNVYQAQYTPQPPAQTPSPPIQQVPTASPRPQSVYHPLQFPHSQTRNQIQNQTPSPNPYQQPLPLKNPPIHRQDSGYSSNLPSRHSSSFSTTSFTPSNYSSNSSYSSPQPTGMLSPQSTGSVYHGRSASVSTMGSGSPLPISMTPQRGQGQMYFPPPPGTPAPPVQGVQGDYFGKVAGVGYNTGVNQQQQQPVQQVYNPGASQSSQYSGQNQQPGQNYGQGQSQGWQWGIPPPQPNYGAPPPIPQPWKSS